MLFIHLFSKYKMPVYAGQCAKFGGFRGKRDIVLAQKMSNEGERVICSKMIVQYECHKGERWGWDALGDWD